MTYEPLVKAGKEFLRKLEHFKYPIFVLSIGLVLMLFPEKNVQQTPHIEEETFEEETDDLEQRLEALLCEVDGAGRVRVVLSVDTGASITYQEDRQQSGQGEHEERSSETVLISRDGNEAPIIVKTTYPVYKGAVVVCQGADSAAVKLRIVQAVSSLTGLGSDKITVVKMKG